MSLHKGTLLCVKHICVVLSSLYMFVLCVCVCVCVYSGWPKLLWVLTDSKNVSKPPREWFPLIKDANNDTAYIEVTDHSIVKQIHIFF